MPSPGAAGLSLLPVFLVFEFNFSIFRDPYFNILNLLIIGFMMISKIPTFSLKSVSLNRQYSTWIILLIAITCIALLSNVWLTLIIIGCVYIISIIYTIIKNLAFRH